MVKVCEYCGKVYITNKNMQNKKYCSRECRDLARRKRTECVCENCGKEFMMPTWRYEKNKKHFCSDYCRQNNSWVTLVCKNCGNEFISKSYLKRKFCSVECSSSYNSSHQPTNRENIVCKNCGKEFEGTMSAEREFCSKECWYDYLKKDSYIKGYKKLRDKTKQEFFEEYNKMTTNVIVDGEYINKTTKVDCHCKEHGTFFRMTPLSILKERNACPKCKVSKGEKAIADYFMENNIKYIPQYTYEDCRDKNKLPFDFYLPDYNTCIEYQGKQHYYPTDFFGGESAMLTTQKHDNIKYDYCKNNNINLLVISYKDYNKIQKILSQFKNVA